MDNSKNMVSNCSLNSNKEKSIHLNEQKNDKIFSKNNIKLKKIKANSFGKDEKKYKIYNKRRILNNRGNSLFSNVEIKKYINETNKSSINKGSDYLPRKIINRNDFNIKDMIIRSLKVQNNYNNESPTKNKKELKEQSTNTYFNDFSNNNYESDTQRMNSLDTNKNNNQEHNIIKPKTTNNKANIYINCSDNIEHINNSNNNKQIKIQTNNRLIKTKPNYVNNVSLNKNINFNNESHKINYKYYLELYKFHLLQAMIQNKSHLFNLRNNNFFKTNSKTTKNPSDINLSSFFKRTNKNKISLRELYRNFNKENNFFNMMKNSPKKIIKIKTYDGKKMNKVKELFNKTNYSKHKLMNVQYNLDINVKNRLNEINKTFFVKRVLKINKKNMKDNNKDEIQTKDYIKTMNNFHKNIFLKKYKYIPKDDLDKGLSNSSAEIKSFLKNTFKSINK